jgi:hypothetical protein
MGKRLVFVVGAGASAEVKLPVGTTLKGEIANLLNLKSDGFNLVSGDAVAWEAVKIFAKEKQITDVNLLRTKCVHIAEAMPLAESIDNFVENKKDDELLSFCAKLGISRAILQAEKNSTLYRVAEQHKPDFSELNNTWYIALFRKIVEQCSRDELEQRLDQLAFIVFNYDRCLETFLEVSISNYYQISIEETRLVLRHLDIYHPYGKLGSIEPSNAEGPIKFGTNATPIELIKSASQIRTFTEGIDELNSDILQIRDIFRNAEKVCFLGFSYVPLNLRLLNAHEAVHERNTNTYIGTSMGLSENTRTSIESFLGKGQRIHRSKLIELKDRSCCNLFHEFDRQLSLVT